MKTSGFYIIFSLLIIFVVFGCNYNTVSDSAKRKFHQCKNYELDVPIEAVDVETNGKKSGETHFPSSSTGSEVFFSYNRFESKETALKHLKENEKRAWRILRKSEIKDNSGYKIGEKMVITTTDGYNLLWTKDSMLNSVSSESLSAIEEIEKDCNL